MSDTFTFSPCKRLKNWRTTQQCVCTNRSFKNLLDKNVQQIVWPATDNYSFFFDNKEVYTINMIDQCGYDCYWSMSNNLLNRFYQSNMYNEKGRLRDKNIFIKDNLNFKTWKFYTKLRQYNDIWLNLNEYSDDPDRPESNSSSAFDIEKAFKAEFGGNTSHGKTCDENLRNRYEIRLVTVIKR